MAGLCNNLREAIIEYDRRSPSVLSEAAVRLERKAGYIDALIELAADGSENLSVGATWMIKQALENGAVFSNSQCQKLADQLHSLSAWDAQLHICQSVRYLSVAKSDARRFADWLIPLCSDNRAFLRAWAVDGLIRLATSDPTLASVARDWLQRARDDSAASVRARARRIDAEGKS